MVPWSTPFSKRWRTDVVPCKPDVCSGGHRINHLNTLVQREAENGSRARAAELSERAQRRAWELFNEMVAAGASKPDGYREPGSVANP